MKKLLGIVLCLMSLQVLALELPSPLVEEGIADVFDSKPEFEVYPNPVVGNTILISIKGITDSGDNTITITNLIGQQLFQYNITSVDIQNGNFKINLEDNNAAKGVAS